MEQGEKLEQAYELELGEKLELVCELEHDIPVCVRGLDEMELAYELELELRNLHKIHLRCSQHSDQLCILHFGVYHREGVRCIHR